jgi:hypothetical protein
VLVLVPVLLLSAACGSKGDPLPPRRLTPAQTKDVTAFRIEGRPIALTFQVPDVNDDGTSPVDVAAMEIFAVTKLATDPPPPASDLIGNEDNRVAEIAVRVPPEAGEEQPGAPETPPADPKAPVLPEPGGTITWEDTAMPPPSGPTPMVRYYVVAGVSRRGRTAAPSAVIGVPLEKLPDAPANLTASFTATSIKLDWLGTTPGTRYRVYEVHPDAAVKETVVSARPVEGTTYEVPIVAEPAPETPAAPAPAPERCFLVRSARVTGAASIESAAAGPVCVTPRDIFPPPAPAHLSAVASGGAISLIWDAVDAGDLAGYIVLRAEAPGDKLLPLFETPIAETTYTDATTVTGTRYVYAVVAVDTAAPANRSAESNRVEETGRQ